MKKKIPHADVLHAGADDGSGNFVPDASREIGAAFEVKLSF